MFNTCPNCGIYHPDKTIKQEADQSFAVCPACGYEHPFLSLPILFLSGPSGVGKSTIGLRLLRETKGLIVIETDIFWIEPLHNDTELRWELMLRVAKNAMQSGQPVIMVGTALPQHHTNSIEKRYFSDMHYLALVCDDQLLENRLKARPEWRGCGTADYITPQLQFNQWLKDNHHLRKPPIQILDNSELSIEKTYQQVCTWIEQKLDKNYVNFL